MKKILLLAVSIITWSPLFAQNNFTGIWQGTLNGVRDLRVSFTITGDDNKALKATLDVPMQGAKDLPCNGVTVNKDSIFIDLKMINGNYKGVLTGVNSMDGTWTQNGMAIPLPLQRTDGKIELNRPQTPKPPFTYNSEDVLFYNDAKSIEYGATITSPKDDKQHPAVILISGSGPQNRDEELFQHKPFAVVADHLTKHGYIVLRVDDRGVGRTGGDRSNATSADFAKDVEAAFAYLKKQKNVDKKKIGLYGHSEGGMIAEMVAAENKDIDFIILMAAPGIKVIDLMTEQSKALLRNGGMDEKAVDAYGILYAGIVNNIMRAHSYDEAGGKIYKNINDWIAKTDKDIVMKTTGIHDSASKAKFAGDFVNAVWNKWTIYFMQYDPQPELEQLSCKVLALNGDKDIQVVSRLNLEGIVKGLAKSKSKVNEVREIPGVNHLFQECTTCTVPEYAELEQTIKPEVLDIITAWLDKNVK